MASSILSVLTVEKARAKVYKASARALYSTSRGARTGNTNVDQHKPMPIPTITWYPIAAVREESAPRVLIRPNPRIVMLHPTQICGLYFLKREIEMPVTMEIGATVKERANISTPDDLGDAPWHPWKYTGK